MKKIKIGIVWARLLDFYYRIKPVGYVAIDVMSITGIKAGGTIIPPIEICKFYIENNIILYDGSKGHIPIPLKRRSRIKLIDSRSEKGQKLLKRLEKTNIQ